MAQWSHKGIQLSPDIVKVSPDVITWKVSADLRREAMRHDAMRARDRFAFEGTEKYRSIERHFRDGHPWEETPLFRDIYTRRFADGETEVRGCPSVETLAKQYAVRVDGMYEDMQRSGWRPETEPIPVYLGHDDELIMGNQGNHRLSVAKLLGVPYVVAEVVGRHPESRAHFERAPRVGPELPACAQHIPAMTTEAERLCYYRLARTGVQTGSIVELGAWLGAATAYLAAGVRDAGALNRVAVYDRFVWKPTHHDKKAGGPIKTSQIEAFRKNLGPLMRHVFVHPGEIGSVVWRGGPVSLLICDAPKRIAEISKTLTVFAKAMRPGSLIVWQDFAYFPSYDIPAAMSRISHRVSLVEAVYPGTTAVFRVEEPWANDEVTPGALALQRWKPSEVESTWDAWAERLPPSMRPRFTCGAAMFLCDLGAHERAEKRLREAIETYPDEVLPKWRYLVEERANLMQRYQTLAKVVKAYV